MCIRDRGTIEDIITFFRELVLRRKLMSNIPSLCQTRWSEQHKCIRVFKEHFVRMMQALEILFIEGNTDTRKGAFQLHSAACKSSFIMAMILIAKYSAMLEPVVNALQSKTLDIVKTSQHIQHIVEMVRSHRKDEEKINDEVLKEANQIAEQLELDLNIPRIFGRQQHRSNHPATNLTEF